MVAKSGKSPLSGLIQEHANDETVVSNVGELPTGIENGIAKLTSIKFGEFKEGKNEGQPFFMAMGNVVTPKVHRVDGVDYPIEGMMTKIGPEPLCDTPDSMGKKKTAGDHVAWMMNELRKLGLDTSGLTTEEELKEACSVLEKEDVYFRFRTWGGPTDEDKNARIQHQWNGVCDWEGSSESGVKEHMTENLDGAAADSGDEEMQIAIGTKAKSLGIDIDEYGTWSDVVKEIGKVSKSSKKGGSKVPAMSNQELGQLADNEGDADVIDALSAEAANLDLDPNDYETWEDLGAAIDEAQGEEPAEYEDTEDEEETYSDMGQRADDGDEDAEADLTAACEEYEIDPNDYATWQEAGAAVDELYYAEEGEEEAEEEEDLDALAAAADEGDQEAAERLYEIADSLEIDADSYDSWADLVPDLSGEEGEEEEEEFVPEKGETYLYADPDYDEPYEVTVTYVSRKNGTVNVEDEEGNVLKGIGWDELQGEE